MTITRDEWLSALVEAGIENKKDEQDAITVQEFMVLMDNMACTTAKARLRVLVETGMAERTWKRVTTNGRVIWHVAYRLLEPKSLPCAAC